MVEGFAMRAVKAKKPATEDLSISCTPELVDAIRRRAEENNISFDRAACDLLRAGIQAESEKKQHLTELLHKIRETDDPKEAESLGDELGSLIFGR